MNLPRPLLIFIAVIGIVIGLFLVLFVRAYLNGPEKERYLIPTDFQGKFRVVYGQECGESPVYEQNRQLLRIPTDGVLLIKHPFKAGFVDNEYYLIDKSGSRKRMCEILDVQEAKLKILGVLLRSTGFFGGPMPDGSSSSKSPLAIRYADFYVYNTGISAINDENTRLQERQEQKIDSLMTAKVENCRKLLHRVNN